MTNRKICPKFALLSLMLLTATAIFVSAKPESAQAYSWETKVVDDVGNKGAHNSIAVDNEDRYLITYIDWTSNDLMFALSEDYGQTWSLSTIDDGDGEEGWWTSLAVDSENNYLVAYHDFANSNLKFAKSENNGTSWTISSITVCEAPDWDYSGGGVSLKVDPSGNYIISHTDYDGTDRLLFSKSIDGGQNWQTTVIESGNDLGVHTSIAAVSSTIYILSYYDETNENPLFTKTTDGGTTWIPRVTVDNAIADDGNINKIAVDLDGNYIIAYCDWTNDKLKISISTNEGASWTTQSLNLTGIYGYSGDYTPLDLIIDLDGNYAITALDRTNESLAFIVSTDGGVNWSEETVEAEVGHSFGLCNALAIDSANTYVISYWDGVPQNDLKFANIPRTFRPFTCSVTINPASISQGSATNVSVTLNDPEYRQSYTYGWTDAPDKGTFTAPSSATTVYTSSPSALGNTTLTMTVGRASDESNVICAGVLGISDVDNESDSNGDQELPQTSDSSVFLIPYFIALPITAATLIIRKIAPQV